MLSTVEAAGAVWPQVAVGQDCVSLAVMSAKRLGELHALSVARDCLRWTSDGLEVTMRPNPAFLHKWFSDVHVNQPIGLPAYAPQPGTEGLQPDSGLLCPIRAIRRYVYATSVAEVGCTVSVGTHRGCALSE